MPFFINKDLIMIERAIEFIMSTRKLFLVETKRYNDFTYIGYCHIQAKGRTVKKNRITKKESLEILTQDVIDINKRLNRILKVELTDNQKIALISLVYDIGIRALLADELLSEINKGNIVNVSNKFRRYGSFKKKPISSLIKARRAEIDLINTIVS